MYWLLAYRHFLSRHNCNVHDVDRDDEVSSALETSREQSFMASVSQLLVSVSRVMVSVSVLVSKVLVSLTPLYFDHDVDALLG